MDCLQRSWGRPSLVKLKLVKLKREGDGQFTGPSVPVLQLPKRAERGTVKGLGDRVAWVEWERSPLLVGWPVDWLKGMTA